jgi:tRNA(adenine34) deaminase
MAALADEMPVMTDEHWMQEALRLAQAAAAAGEVPVGAVIIHNGNIVGSAHNSPVTTGDPTAHAEILAIREAARILNNYRLVGCTLYATLEPCPMCAGALVNARVDRLVFGARDIRYGGVRSKFRISDSELLNHRVSVTEGVLASHCLELLQSFFSDRR